MKKIFVLLFSITGLSVASELDNLARQYYADKSSDWHNYVVVYEKYFSPLKNKPIKFLEIGLAMGYSAKMWRDYFTYADLHFIENQQHFIDIYQATNPVKSRCYLLDQANEFDLLKFVDESGGNFDIILDDGGHQMDQQITSFRILFPTVKSGGMYIIEDLATSYTASGHYCTESKPGTTVCFLKVLVDEINSFGSKPVGLPYFCANYAKYNDLNYYQENIESMHFYNGTVIIFKR